MESGNQAKYSSYLTILDFQGNRKGYLNKMYLMLKDFLCLNIREKPNEQ